MGLRWSDIDFKEKRFTVNRTLNRLKNYNLDEVAGTQMKSKLTLSDPKTYSSHRTIPLTGQTYDILKREEMIQAKGKLLLGLSYNQGGFVFCTELGNPIEPRTLFDFYKRLCSLASVPQITLHAMRHPYVKLPLKFFCKYFLNDLTADWQPNKTNDGDYLSKGFYITSHTFYSAYYHKIRDFPIYLNPIAGVNVDFIDK